MAVVPPDVGAADVGTTADGREVAGPEATTAETSPPEGDVFTPRDGKRIKIRWARPTGGGAAVAIGHWDSLLKAPCRFLRASDGELRCLPNDEDWSSSTYFADASCTTVLGEHNTPACNAPEFITVRVPRPPLRCSQSVTSVFRRGARVTTGQYHQIDYAAEACGPARAITERHVFYAAGPEVAPSMFVKGAPVPSPPAPGGAALDLVLLQGEDGVTDVWSWQNTATKETCVDFALGDGTIRCISGGITIPSGGYFADATCSEQPLASSRAGCPQTIRFAAVPKAATCPVVTTLRPLEARATMSHAVYSDGSCRPLPAASTADYVHLGPPGAEQSFPELKEVKEASGERLRRRLTVAPNGRSTAWGWWDSVLREFCHVQMVAGSSRCVPNGAGYLSTYWADAACTVPLWQTRPGECRKAYAYLPRTDLCPRLVSVFAVGPVHNGEVFSRINALGTCAPASPTQIQAMVFHGVTPIPEGQLAEITLDAP